MHLLLHRYFIILELLFVALIAFLLADGVGNLLLIELTDSLPEKETSVPRPRPSPALKERPRYQHTVRGDNILSRNLFDSSKGAISREPEPTVSTDEQDTAGENEEMPLAPCRIPGLKLDATVAVENEPSLSMASVEVKNETQIYRVGDALIDGQVAWISWKYLILENAESYCYIDLFDNEKWDRSKKKGRPNRKELKRGIKSKGRYRRVVDRGILERLLRNPGRLLRGIKTRPYKKGKTRGYKIRRVNRKHPAYMLGLRKNDIVQSVNGQTLSDMGSTLSALGKLRNQRRWKVDIVRKGKSRQLDIRIR